MRRDHHGPSTVAVGAMVVATRRPRQNLITDASNRIKSNRFCPEEITVDAWISDLDEQLTSPFCKDVMQYFGYESYIRQSNDMYKEMLAAERKYRAAHPNFAQDGFSGDGFWTGLLPPK